MTNRALLRILERERESFAAERRLLIEQICHLSRQPWVPSPSDMRDLPDPEDDSEPSLVHADHWPE